MDEVLRVHDAVVGALPVVVTSPEHVQKRVDRFAAPTALGNFFLVWVEPLRRPYAM